jgi:tetratricopeptide (TPR) repeat protein
METITDGRIMEFVLNLPPSSKTKVLITSRRRTSNWEYPIQVTELDDDEVKDFVIEKCREMNLALHFDDPTIIQQIRTMSGGLPLAIQWILGEYAKTGNLDKILSRSLSPDSPLLEFSFRNSWNVLDKEAQEALSVLSIFDSPPTLHEWRTSLDWNIERLEKSISALIEVTFITERTENKTGKKVYSALPITLSFARNELAKFIGLETQARLRLQNYRNRMDLASVETGRYDEWFDKFEAKTEMQKKAVILCRLADGQARSLDYQGANQYYRQALEAEPHSVFALVSYGIFKADIGNHGEAIELLKQAAKYCTKKTGYYVFFSLSKIYDQVHDRPNKIQSLRKALEYEPKHTIARHSLGVALSQSGNFKDALHIFDEIIKEELSKKDGPSESLVYAYKTKIITLRRAKRDHDAVSTLQEAKKILEKFSDLKYLIKRLDDLLDD